MFLRGRGLCTELFYASINPYFVSLLFTILLSLHAITLLVLFERCLLVLTIPANCPGTSGTVLDLLAVPELMLLSSVLHARCYLS